MSGRRGFEVGAVTAVVLATAALAAGAAQPGARAAGGERGAAAAGAGISFSHGVPVDEQRPGFEPDVVVDPNPQGTDDGERVYSSIPFGFSTTESFLSMSRDAGETYKLTAGNIGPGKPTTCVGGGDTELQLDRHGAIFFSDLQGLTNLSNSVSTDHGAHFVTNCAAAPNTPVDRMWYAHSGALADGDLSLYEEYDAVASSLPSLQNQLVETISHDGVSFAPLVNPNATSDCLGAGAANCVNDNEGLPGNQLVDPASGDIFIAHTAPGASSGAVAPQVLVERGHLHTGTVTTVTWQHIGPLDAALCPDPTCVDADGNPEVVAAENFPVIAEDRAHHFYVAFASAPVNHRTNDPNIGALTAPEQIYVAASLDGTHWQAPVQVSRGGTNTFPWIVAGSDGRVDLAWYHSDETSEQGPCPGGSGTCTNYGAAELHNAEWSVQFAQSLDAHAPAPQYTVRTASEHFVKHGEICTNGLGCTTGGDRSLGDFMQITVDKHGAALISYVDDTSNNVSGGEAAGPAEIVRQTSGPSILAGTGPVNDKVGPGRRTGSVPDDPGDASYDANGTSTPASPNLDLTGASLGQDASGNLVVRIRVRSLASLAVSPTLGGANASWLARWVQVVPGTPGNGHIYYAGMESDAGGAPRFFDGDASCQIQTTHCKYLTYPGDRAISGRYSASTGTITLHVPLADIGQPASGTTLYSVVAFTTTEAQPLTADPIFNVIDASEPFDVTLR